MKKNSITCYLIGDDHLLLECAGILLSNNHIILGIISATAAAEAFALQKKIPYFRKLNDVMSLLSITSFDYLFSIVNGAILPPTLLQQAKWMAINYHNGPLPRYAGLHAPSWAILNKERIHGVTWHEMVEKIDAGDILKQAFIDIEPDETGLSLSVKCYQAALSTFKELIYEINFGNLRPLPQNPADRVYFDYYKKPQYGGWISWRESAEVIDRTCRALNLGNHHANRFSLPKFNIGKDFFIISQLRVLKQASQCPPGTLLMIKPKYWRIATKTQIVQLEQVMSWKGEERQFNFVQLAHCYQLKEGSRLSLAADKTRIEYQHVYESYAAHEMFWVHQTKTFIPAVLPFQSLSVMPRACSLKCIAKLDIANQDVLLSKEYSHTNMLFAALFIYLYRLGNKEKFGVGFVHSKLQQLPAAISPLFSQVIPFSFRMNEDLTVKETLHEFFNHLQSLDKRLSFSRDIFFRHPELSISSNSFYPITVIIGHEKELLKQIRQVRASVIVTISESYQLCWYSRETSKELTTIIRNSILHLPILIEGMIQQPTLLISQLPLLSPQEKERLLVTWNKTQTSYPCNKNVIELFVEQVQRTPQQIALSYEGYSWSYQAFHDQSNQVARFLQKRGIGIRSHVAICTDQERHLLVGLLAILKLGAVYVPIDRRYPASHIQFMLSDSSSSMVIASKSIKLKVQACCDSQNVPLIIFEDLIKAAAFESNDDLDFSLVDANSPAYIIYTSGTTRKPRGVIIPHRGINRLVTSTNYIKITPKDRIAQVASIGFDAATFEIWGALLNGATLVAFPYTALINVIQFSQFLTRKKITILWLTSALFHQYASLKPTMFNPLSYLLVGGDIVNAEQIAKVIDCGQKAPTHILNSYGPTENTTFTTTYTIKPKEKGYQSIPIGKPIANTTVYVLDQYLHPVPIGAPGELYTGGAGVALGYLNRPEITTARFIPNPFDPDAASLLYKTGDIVRWLPDGNLDYLNRRDNQVKIRGFRVELETVYTVLLAHESIEQCAVKVYENKTFQKSIVAYIVLKDDISIASIQQYMATQLPSYMIPSFFITIDNIPLNLNGKVDFEKLPIPNFSSHSLQTEYVAPHTQAEKEIEKIWAEMFDNNQIGIHDSFFDLGGHSLMVSQLVLKIKEQLFYNLSVQQFLAEPTIAHLAHLVDMNVETEPLSFKSHWQFDVEFSLPYSVHSPALLAHTPQAVLLTGANGFLGANLLNQLYHLTSSTLYCLVRGGNSDDAKNKLQKAISQYGLQLEDDKRIHLLVGDLGKPYLGLAIEEFMFLSETIDVIYHNGAAVHHLYDYGMLRAVNVQSIKEILKLATLKKHIPIHYVSTLSAVGKHIDKFNTITEDFIAFQPNLAPKDGYSQTKWVAEQLLAKAHQQQLQVKIYRPAWILGDSTTGAIIAEHNHLLLLIKGCYQLGCAPAWNVSVDLLPVDYVSQMIIKTSLSKKIPYDVFNLSNPNKISWHHLIGYLNQRGYNITLISPQEWRKKLSREINLESTLYSLFTLYINQNDNDWMEGLKQISRASNHNTRFAFKENDMVFPLINQQLLDTYFDFLERQGFLKINSSLFEVS